MTHTYFCHGSFAIQFNTNAKITYMTSYDAILNYFNNIRTRHIITFDDVYLLYDVHMDTMPSSPNSRLSHLISR